jgi:hypothetical protein
MKEFIVTTEFSEVKFNFPTNLKELSSDYLTKVTSNVTVAPNYSLIGIVYHERLANIIITCKNKKKNAAFGIVPIFIKSGAGDPSIVDNAKVGQKLLIGSSQIQIAHHCAVPANKLTVDYFATVVDNSVDKELYQKAVQDPDQSEVLFVEFKIVSNCDIVALYDDVVKINNPYITVSANKEQ